MYSNLYKGVIATMTVGEFNELAKSSPRKNSSFAPTGNPKNLVRKLLDD